MDSSGVQEAQARKKGRGLFQSTIADIEASGSRKVMDGQKTVVAPFFRVTFATDGKYRNSVGGITTATSKVYSKLNGVEEQTFQDITDNMYKNWIEELKAAGFEVLDNSVLETSANFKKVDDVYPEVKKDHAMFTPTGLSFTDGFSDKSTLIANEVGVPVLKADLTVNFVIINRNEKKFSLTTSKAQVWVSQGINVLGEVTASNAKGQRKYTIGQPVTSDKAFGELVDATTGANKASDTVVAVAGALTDGLGSKRQSTMTVEVNAKGDEYQVAVEDAITQANQKVAQFIAAEE